MENFLITLFIIAFGIGGYCLGFYYGKRNYKFVSHDKVKIEFEVDTKIAEERLRFLRRDVILLTKEIERLNKLDSNSQTNHQQPNKHP